MIGCTICLPGKSRRMYQLLVRKESVADVVSLRKELPVLGFGLISEVFIMKCTACGYQKGWDWVGNFFAGTDEYAEVNPDGESFVKLMIPCSTDQGRSVKLYGCPKCNAVIFKEV